MTVRCGSCGKEQEDRGKRATCIKCGFSPLPSVEYPEESCFRPGYVGRAAKQDVDVSELYDEIRKARKDRLTGLKGGVRMERGYEIPESSYIKSRMWKSGGKAWATDEDGCYRMVRLTCRPFKCDDGVTRVLVEDQDGVWEIPISSLSKNRPKEGQLSRQSPLFKEEHIMSKKKAASSGKANLCRCGCGEECARNFKQGHDSRFHGRVKKLQDGRLSMADIRKDKAIAPYAYKFYEEAMSEKPAKKTATTKKAVKKKTTKKTTKKKAATKKKAKAAAD